MPRALWKGQLRIALVSCAVKLYPALSAAEEIHFHLLNRETGHRIQLRPHDPETGEEVPKGELVKGYEFEKGRYAVIGKEELDQLKLAAPHVIEIEEFVASGEIDRAYFDHPYYIGPDGADAARTYRVLREAMTERGRVGLGRMVYQSRERRVALEPYQLGMRLTTLLSAAEVRDDSAYFDEIGDAPLDPEMIDLAALIVAKKSGPFEPSRFIDRYQEELRKLIAAKAAGKTFTPRKAPAPAPVINLKDVLRRAAAADGGASAGTRKPRLSKAAAGDKPTATRRRKKTT
jgi:DNA end-binding protein Ku